MKYGLLLKTIQNPKYNYINYDSLKENISSTEFCKMLYEEISSFDKYYMDLKSNHIYNNKNLYELIVINYVTINKIIKKYNKYNTDSPFKNPIKLKNIFNETIFYKDLTNISNMLVDSNTTELSNGLDGCKPCYNCNSSIQKCPICLDKVSFPVQLECKHIFCWSCLLQTAKKFTCCPYCRKKCELDPVINVINNIFPGNIDSKYSPFANQLRQNNKINQKFELMSDLHIDYWDHKLKTNTPCGSIKTFPQKLEEKLDTILVIAGDISDSLHKSLSYLDLISKYYKEILFVDGNHEHTDIYPKLYTIEYINNEIKKLNNDKIRYLPKNDYILGNTVFIGACGWWDFNDDDDLTFNSQSENYFKEWIPEFREKETRLFNQNVLERSKLEFEILKNKISLYENNDDIDDIIIVTHTVPLIKYCNGYTDTDINMKLSGLCKNSMKLKTWIFGHTHSYFDDIYKDIKFICNPRGRPDDFDRIEYNGISFQI